MKLDYNSIAASVGAVLKLLPNHIRAEVSKQSIPGPRGFTGIHGAKGDSGSRGLPGAQGKAGTEGKTGIMGPTGKRGESGLQGLTGTTGKPGRMGNDGRMGKRGIVGDAGPQGPMGPQGETGRAPEHQWIGSKLRFRNPDNSWGNLVELRGFAGDRGESFFSDVIFGGQLIVTANDYLTNGNIRLVATAPITVDLNPAPTNDETVFIKMINGDVLIKGNGNLIDGETTQTIFIQYTALRLMYAYDLKQWLVT